MVQDGHFDFVSVPDTCSDAHAASQRLNLLTEEWHLEQATATAPDLLSMLHAANFELWHLEDEARNPLASNMEIASAKRSIDQVNQRRNDTVEQIDEALVEALHIDPGYTSVPLHSETPGQILDRLSILSLKLFHTGEEANRQDADQKHRDRNAQRLHVLRQQQNDLAGCLTQLWQEILQGKRRFKRYRQFKMYNDPELNPVIYNSQKSESKL